DVEQKFDQPQGEFEDQAGEPDHQPQQEWHHQPAAAEGDELDPTGDLVHLGCATRGRVQMVTSGKRLNCTAAISPTASALSDDVPFTFRRPLCRFSRERKRPGHDGLTPCNSTYQANLPDPFQNGV